MKIRKLRLRNWCQYRDATFEFDSGLTAVRGPNGVGKSNLVTGIVFGATGDFSRNSGVKNDNICQQRLPGEPSFVELEFEHAGAEVTITRRLPSGQELKIAGDPAVYNRDREVSEQMRKLLGVSERLLLDYVFVEQWKMFDFISKKPADRATAFAQLFQTDQAERIWKALGEYTVPIPRTVIDADAVRVQLQQHRNRLAEVNRELAGYADIPDNWDHRTDPNFRLMEEWLRKKDLISRQALAQVRVDQLGKQIAPLDDQLAEARNNEVAIRTAIDAARADADVAQKDMTALRLYEINQGQRQRLNRLLEQLEQQNRMVVFPVPSATYVGPSEQEKLKEERQEIESRRATIKLFLTQFADGKVPACPICGTPAARLRDRVLSFQEELDRLEQRYAAVCSLLAEAIDHDNRVEKYRAWQDRYQQQKKDLIGQISAIGHEEPPLRTREELQAVIDDYRVLQEGLEAVRQTIRDIEVKRSRLAGMLETEGKGLASMAAEIEKITVGDAEAEAAQKTINDMLARFRRKEQLAAEAGMLNQQIVNETQMLSQAAAEAARVRRAERLQTHLNEVRAVFHRDNLPRKVAQAYLDRMRGEINEVLGVFNSPFRVEDVSDLRFTIRKSDGTVQPAERLSGGEKVVFAIAFRIVVNSMFARELGLLCLDEPTAGLDEDNLSCMEAALGRLRELSRARNLQVILITHERGMDSLFDRVIQLPLLSDEVRNGNGR